MKMLILALSSLVAVSSFAQTEPCNGNLEAQFVAQIDKVQQSSFGLKNFRLFNPNMNCPLSLGEAQAALIKVPQMNPYYKEGNEISGILVFDPQSNTYWLD